MAQLLLDIAREGGSAAGGALAVLLAVSWMVLTERLVTRGRFLDKQRQLDAALRELRRTTRALQAGVNVAEKLPKKGS